MRASAQRKDQSGGTKQLRHVHGRTSHAARIRVHDLEPVERDEVTALNEDSACDEVTLIRLLNELDGLRERADVFFILTMNRPDTLEPALASRPARIDQAIEFPLPDERLRRQLVALYARSLELSPDLMDDLAHRTDGPAQHSSLEAKPLPAIR
jgi:ATP-dependent Zn protease